MLDTFEDSWLDSTVCSVVEQAIAHEHCYKGMLLQGDDVDIRIELWREGIEICKMDFTSKSCTHIYKS
jgi:hypothetical protein